MRTIRLELLRHGPPHNQLLSPLTEYLALCENHQAVSVELGFEHAEFMQRLYGLRYKSGTEDTRPLAVEDMAARMASILSQVPGLIRELAEQTGDATQLFHLRLILSANELALLPFELANAPHGFAGAGQSLLLHSQAPVCLTREVRRVDTETADDSESPPKILFAAAGPGRPVPLEAHVLALRNAIQPWVRHYHKEANDGGAQGPEDPPHASRRQRIAEHLTVLPQATLREIEHECATGKYTHVHVLAHGIPVKKGDDRRFGLALHHSSRRELEDIVTGGRLSKALRPPRACDKGFVRPNVVTLAACDAGGVGSVEGAGASIAHALHEDGIPLVIASQLPLSFAGSVVMVQVLYEGFLEGCDPRSLLVNLRRRLRTQVPATHDWASIVAYASFPPDLDERVADFRRSQAFRRLEAAINHADRTLLSAASRDAGSPADLELQLKNINAARNHLESLLSDGLDATVYGLVASADKRLAQLLLRFWGASEGPGVGRSDVRERLASSRKFYEKAFERDCSQAWALVQALALTAVSQRWSPADEISRDQWDLARILSEEELRSRDGTRIAWAHANLMELYLLVPMVPGFDAKDRRGLRDKARAHAEKFRKVADQSSIEIHSTRRQLLRYPEFFVIVNGELKALAAAAQELANLIPESEIYA